MQAHQELVNTLISVGDPIIGEIEDVAELSAQADSGLSRLSPEDRERFLVLSNRRMVLHELAFYQRQEGLLGDDLWDAVREPVERSLERPGFAEYWDYDKRVFGVTFVEWVEGL